MKEIKESKKLSNQKWKKLIKLNKTTSRIENKYNFIKLDQWVNKKKQTNIMPKERGTIL